MQTSNHARDAALLKRALDILEAIAGYDRRPSHPDMNALLAAWEPALRQVAAARAAMEAGHYHTPLREAYEAACANRDALFAAIRAD